MNNHSEAELIEGIKAGKVSAFDEFYYRNWKELYKIAFRSVYSNDDAIELVQNVFIGFWNNRRNLDADKCVQAYLKRALKNQIINFYRKETLIKKKLAEMDLTEGSFSIEDNIYARELAEMINFQVKQLPQKMQEVYLLSRKENLSVVQISEQLQITPRTVKNQISNALKILREKLSVVKIL